MNSRLCVPINTLNSSAIIDHSASLYVRSKSRPSDYARASSLDVAIFKRNFSLEVLFAAMLL